MRTPTKDEPFEMCLWSLAIPRIYSQTQGNRGRPRQNKGNYKMTTSKSIQELKGLQGHLVYIGKFISNLFG